MVDKSKGEVKGQNKEGDDEERHEEAAVGKISIVLHMNRTFLSIFTDSEKFQPFKSIHKNFSYVVSFFLFTFYVKGDRTE